MRQHSIEGQFSINFEAWDSEPEFSNEPDALHSVIKEPVDVSRRLNYISLGSGSSGNCCYLGNNRGGILIDAGVKADDVVRELASNGVPMSKVRAILLTHDHSDHLRYVYTLLRGNKHISLFCTNRVLNAILRRHSISKRIKEYHVPIFKEIPFKILDFEITAFEVPHDSADSMGFSIMFDDRHFVIATDMGSVSDRARHYISQANYLVIESNYDKRMLIMGKYPEYLKARIQTDQGHMDNEDTAGFIAGIMNPGLKYVFLCHLSQDNNTPQIAWKATADALRRRGLRVGDCRDRGSDIKADVRLMALPRTEPSPWFVFFPFEK